MRERLDSAMENSFFKTSYRNTFDYQQKHETQREAVKRMIKQNNFYKSLPHTIKRNLYQTNELTSLSPEKNKTFFYHSVYGNDDEQSIAHTQTHTQRTKITSDMKINENERNDTIELKNCNHSERKESIEEKPRFLAKRTLNGSFNAKKSNFAMILEELKARRALRYQQRQ
mmetsp:Transcript_34490/g.33678  ORF Transcript_34490/g.33678 Transcript_34490/m.33678 type:complete len:171 (-) Transcript_34490:43-555(-)|eukprot:CAMPEP_0170557748 /NCGR_PEP_ID=MMETSP0211-20121228/29759_1 /TAXON_ID=311385 /ORGANISM="Pseudokeronopsis sp., Strain OXSARD2" /LENGTH=170 /DNA_ID=CAMNT_0010869045 /DNA_START=468 /DNA_END=980 /DNA_ORIENTATION=-